MSGLTRAIYKCKRRANFFLHSQQVIEDLKHNVLKTESSKHTENWYE